jgi:hypothetical protein
LWWGESGANAPSAITVLTSVLAFIRRHAIRRTGWTRPQHSGSFVKSRGDKKVSLLSGIHLGVSNRQINLTVQGPLLFLGVPAHGGDSNLLLKKHLVLADP